MAMEQINRSMDKSENDTQALLKSLRQENAARKKSEENLRKAQEFAKVGQWSHNPKTSELHCSWLIYKIFGIDINDSKTDIVSLFRKSIHPDDQQQFHNLYAPPCPKEFTMNYRLIAPDGRITRIYSKGEVSFDEDGNPDKVFGVDQDITEKWQIQENLRQSEMFFKESQRAAFIGSYKLDFTTGYWESSEVLDSIFGIDKNYSKTVQGWLNLVHPDDRKMMNQYFKEDVTAQHKSFNKEYRIIRKDDSKIRWVSGLGKINFDAEGNLTSMVGTIQDVTERKQAEDALRESNELNTSLLKTIPFGMDIVDECGNIMFICDSLKKLFGRDITGKRCWELYRDDKLQCADCPLQNGINIGQTDIYETEGIMGGKTFQISHTGMMFQGKKAMLEIFQDITERKRNENELVLAKEKAEESNRLKTAFLNNMSHEIRTPMNAIMGFSDLIIEAKEGEKDSFAEIIHKSSAQLLMLIDDVILLSRLQSEKMRSNSIEFKPAELVTDISRMFNLPDLKKGLNITANIPARHKNTTIQSDSDKIKQILTNFASNAVKYTLKGGVKIGFDLQNGHIEFYVEDTGIGIPEQEQDLIFDAFYRGEQVISAAIRGTGLGLSIAKELVRSLGGKIGVISKPNQGSRFYFTIPAKQPAYTHHQKALPQTDHRSWTDFTILIVEDEHINYQYLEIILKDKVKKIDRAMNGKEAVELASNNNYDFILMDLKLPEMDGIEATRIIKQQFPDLPVIVQTAHALPDEKTRALSAGCDKFISKPFKKADLIEIINQAIS